VQRTLLLLLVAASYALLAGGRNWTLAPLLLMAMAAALAAPRRTFTFPAATRALDIALIAILGVIALQLVPLPAAVVRLLSPHAAAVKRAIRVSPLAGSESWTTLTVNPDATLIALATAGLGIASFWIARAVFAAGGNTRVVCRALTFFGTLAAMLAVIQRAVAPRTVLFLIEPEARSASPFGAFVNRNHFATWLLLMMLPVAGYCIARLHMRPVAPHWRQSIGQLMSSGAVFTAVGVFVQVGVLLLTLSRSALAGLATAAAAASLMARQRLRIERIRVPMVFGAAAAALAMVVLFVDLEGWAQRMEHDLTGGDARLGRLTIWRETMPLLRDFWLTGSGAGTFGDAMVTYQQSRVWVGSMQKWAHFNNAHSHYVQIAAEGGMLLVLPVFAALLLIANLGVRAVRADKGEMFWVRVGAAAAIAAIGVQSIWEIGLVMPANAVLAGVVAALLLYRREPAKC
jgi:putative inorganic carbon (hco3(-)) transporter